MNEECVESWWEAVVADFNLEFMVGRGNNERNLKILAGFEFGTSE
jgi:hypothetical protein